MPLLLLAAFFIIAFIISRIQSVSEKRKLRVRLSKLYGEKPEKKKIETERISKYWEQFSKTSKDETIDDITWNDLEMDKIFERTNYCRSYVGEQAMYYRLHQLPYQESRGNSFERKIQYFDEHEKERIDVQMILSDIGRDYYAYDFIEFLGDISLNSIRGVWKYRVMQYILLLMVVASIVVRLPVFFLMTGIVFSINLLLYTIGKMRYEANLDMLKCVAGIIDAGMKISNSKKLEYELNFKDLAKKIVPFKKISRSIGVLNFKKEMSRSGDALGLVYDYLIGATLYDFVKYEEVIQTLMREQDGFVKLFETIGEIDTAISVALFRASLKRYCIPKFSEKHVLEMKSLYHPLIDEPVCNDTYLNGGTIITGSNASGKSTFIKAAAINLILAQNINTCLADEVIVPRAKVVTSMAVRDDLSSGESYYIKEIKYLKRIIDDLKEDRLLICVIDEILRGTNTEERLAASTAVLKYLRTKNCMAIVASHDVELTQLLDNIYDNYHFTEHMDNRDILFDYTLYPGASTSKNAIKLLKHIGFPDEIITDAFLMTD